MTIIDAIKKGLKAAGVNLDTVVKEYIKFSLKKDKYYTYNTKDLIRQEVEEEDKEEKSEKEKKSEK
jgi:predicted metal-dependent peptidase